MHCAIGKILDITQRTWGTTLLTTVIRHCHLQLDDVHVVLQSPCLHDLSCSLHMKKFGAGSQVTTARCFVSGFMSSLFLPFEENSFSVDVNGFEIALNSEKGSSSVFPATDMSALVILSHLQSVSFCFHVPALNFIFSPSNLSVILLFCRLLSKEHKYARSGRQLWDVVAAKVSSLLPVPNLSVIKVVRTMCIWLRYMKTYQSMLLLVGYPADEIIKRSATSMFHDAAFARSVKYQWKLIAEIEKDLPLESIAVARRIIRYRVASQGPGENGNRDELQASRPFSKLCQLLILILSMIGNLLISFARILFLHKVLTIFPKRDLHSAYVSENPILQRSITLDIQEISVSLSPDKPIQFITHGNAVSEPHISYGDLFSFYFSMDGFFLRYVENISENCFTFASGRLKVLSSSTATAGPSSYSEERQKKEVDKRQIVIWGEPAEIFCVPEGACGDVTDDIARTSDPHLDRLLGKLWLNWKNTCLKSGEDNIPSMQAPWVLSEVWTCLIDHGFSDSSSRFSCSLVVGKLNFNLEYYSFASAVVILSQIQSGFGWSLRRKNVISHTPTFTVQDPPVRSWNSIFTSYSSEIEMGIIRMLPEKHVEIGVLVAGPQILISLRNDQFHAKIPNSHHLVTQVSLEICNVELLVSDNVGLSSENTSQCDVGPECLGLKEPQETNISKSDNGDYSCQGKMSLKADLKVHGLKAYFDEASENKKSQIIVLRPITTHLSYMR